jgi:methionyl-tRNA formyltransferase
MSLQKNRSSVQVCLEEIASIKEGRAFALAPGSHCPEASLRIVFIASGEIACPSLDRLVRDGHYKPVLVVTQPDRPKGRSLHTASCPALLTARSMGIPVYSPDSINTPEAIARLREVSADVFVVIAYGQILKTTVLRIPLLACINLHASLLPRYRGAAPIQWAIADGTEVTGMTSMHMNDKMDEGDIIYQQEEHILPDDTAGALHDRLAIIGADVLVKTLSALEQRNAPRIPQEKGKATYAAKIRKEDGRIDWTIPAVRLNNRVRAFNPWPMCWCLWPGAAEPVYLRIHKCRAEDARGRAGEVLSANAEGPLVGAGEGALRLLEVQPAGGKRMSAAAFMAGHTVPIGAKLG